MKPSFVTATFQSKHVDGSAGALDVHVLGMHLLEQIQVLWHTYLPNRFQHLRSRVHVTYPLEQPRLLALPPPRRRPSRQTSLLHIHTPLIYLCQPRRLLQHNRDAGICR